MASSSLINSSERYTTPSEDERKVLDDFYWLRFLELDVPSESRNRASQSQKKMDKMGQSMFTVTKRLRKEDEWVRWEVQLFPGFSLSSSFSSHFGFEQNIIWTKPCIINRVVKDSPADRSHLEPGDFIIFVDKVNVVDLKQSEIQDLINDKEALTVEVFRRADMKMQIQNLEKSPIKSLSTTTNRTLSSIHVETSIESSSSNDVKRNVLITKVSTESKKRPLVTFSKEEVKGERGEKEVLV